MRDPLRKGLSWIIIGLLAVIAGQILLIRKKNLGPELVLKRESQRVSRNIAEAKEAIDSELGKLYRYKSFDTDSSAVQFLLQNGVDLFVFKENKPEFWTTNAYNVIPTYGRQSGIQIQKHASKYVVMWIFHNDTQEFVFCREIIANPEFRFVSGSSLQEENQNKFSVSVNPLEGSIPVQTKGMPLFYLVIDQYTPGIGFDILILAGLLMITIGIIIIFRKTKFWYLNYILCIGIWIFTEYLFYKNSTLWNLKSTALFAPEVYASSWYFPNLGVFLFNALAAFLISVFLLRIVKNTVGRINPFWVRVLRYFTTAVICLFTAFYLYETGYLVRDSSIIFDFHEIYLVSIFTILGLIGLALGIGVLLNLLQVLHLLRGKTGSLVLVLGLIAGFGIWMMQDGGVLNGWLFLLLAGGLVLLGHLVQSVRPWWFYGVKILIPCVVTGIIFNREVGQKEIQLREILAAKLLLQSEREPTNLLQRTELELQADKGIVDYYTCTDVSKSDFEKRLRQLYFTDYSEDYEILLFDYNSVGGGYREENVFDYTTLDNLFSSEAVKPVTRNFGMVNERKLKGSFLGKFPVSDSGFRYGTYFVLLKPRISAAQGRLSDVFHKSPLDAIFTDNQYSYAFYSQNKLSRRYGQYNYQNNYNFNEKINPVIRNGFSHFVYSDDLGNLIVISKPIKSWLEALTAFTILVLSCLVVGLLYLLILLIQQYFLSVGKTSYKRLRLLHLVKNRIPANTGSDLFLSSKLQLYVILVVFATFLVVLGVTINYFKNSYSVRQREFLWNKTNEIANAIGTQANLDALFDKYQTGLVYDLSNYYSTDINIYNANGRMLVSSNDRIYDQDIIGSLMNPEAFKEFRTKGISGFIREEGIGDLKYISAYYTIFDNDLNVKGYLNLPYFTNRQDLFREISNYSTTVINLFALVFALAALVAYVIAHRITEPLNLIRRQMGAVKLGAKNAPISWQHNDEIGLLIAEYNKMIDELEESSNKLAEGERQGAWREMAKQVAHEIKNPLTPMKLSLQHLQLAMQKKDPNVEEMIRKTSELLIKQIDSLSQMAEEFSAFAKMPEAEVEVVVLNDLLDEAVQLFEKDENCTIHYKPIPKKVRVRADANQLNRVFTNIIKNAMQAIPEDRKGLLRISSVIRDGNITVSFEDNGKGIPEELKKKIFNPNFSTKNSGMGLGLAISRKIIEQFSGTIDFTSRPDKGSTFFVTLPVLET